MGMAGIIRFRSRREGFSLLEVLIATAVIGIAFFAAASMQVTSIGGNHKSRLRTEAVYLAQDLFEDMRNRDFMDINNNGSPQTNIDETGNSGGIYTRSWQVQFDTPGVLMRTVTVTIDWQERGIGHNLVMSTVFYSNS
jgi:prepilin-type N-terminal cleavage/methylation domain-containing protein